MVDAMTGEIKLKDSLNNDKLNQVFYEVSVYETLIFVMNQLK